jgi:hypothetical protein
MSDQQDFDELAAQAVIAAHQRDHLRALQAYTSPQKCDQSIGRTVGVAVARRPEHEQLIVTRLRDGGFTVSKPYNVYTDDKASPIFAASEIKDALAFVWTKLEPAPEA